MTVGDVNSHIPRSISNWFKIKGVFFPEKNHEIGLEICSQSNALFMFIKT